MVAGGMEVRWRQAGFTVLPISSYRQYTINGGCMDGDVYDRQACWPVHFLPLAMEMAAKAGRRGWVEASGLTCPSQTKSSIGGQYKR